jgi:hypothetical protein
MKGGKRSTTWEKGMAPKKQPGTKHSRTKLKEALGLSGWEKLEEYLTNQGPEQLIEALTELQAKNPKEFVHAFAQLLEYVKPRLQRTAIEATLREEKTLQVLNVEALSLEAAKEILRVINDVGNVPVPIDYEVQKALPMGGFK